MTLHGYMGLDSVAPFLKDSRAGVFVLCKTSNPTSEDFQTLYCSRTAGGQARYVTSGGIGTAALGGWSSYASET